MDDDLAIAYATSPVVRTLEQWVLVWSDEGRRYGACATSGGGIGFRGCAANLDGTTAVLLLCVVLGVGCWVVWCVRRIRGALR